MINVAELSIVLSRPFTNADLAELVRAAGGTVVRTDGARITFRGTFLGGWPRDWTSRQKALRESPLALCTYGYVSLEPARGEHAVAFGVSAVDALLLPFVLLGVAIASWCSPNTGAPFGCLLPIVAAFSAWLVASRSGRIARQFLMLVAERDAPGSSKDLVRLEE